jgi:TRAP-type transport system periplasmic protein
MHRRTLIISATAAAMTHAGAARAFTQTARTLTFGYTLPQAPQLGAGAKVFGDEVARRTGGRYKIEQNLSAPPGGEAGMIKSIQAGTVDLGFVTGAPLANYVWHVGVFSIPFIFRDAADAHAMVDGPVGQACLAKFRDSNLVGLAWRENGMRQITNAKRPIRTPADLKGLKLIVPQSAVMMIGFEAFGADVSVLPIPELLGALQSGRFDGQENPIATIQAAGIWQVQKHLTLSDHIYDPAVIFMSPTAYDSLPEQDRKAFTEAAKLAGLASRRYAAAARAKALETSRQAGVEVVPGIDRKQFVAAMEPARQKFVELFSSGLVGWVENAS